MSTTITTSRLVEENSNWNDTSVCQPSPWSSSLGCSCPPRCRRPKTNMAIMLHVESMENFHVNHNHYSISYPRWRKFQLRWYILISATFLVFSLLSLLSIVMLTTKPHDQKLGKKRTFDEHQSPPVHLSLGGVGLNWIKIAKSTVGCLLPFRS